MEIWFLRGTLAGVFAVFRVSDSYDTNYLYVNLCEYHAKWKH